MSLNIDTFNDINIDTKNVIKYRPYCDSEIQNSNKSLISLL
jgi:hypothetical protein